MVETTEKPSKWTDRDRVLGICSRGCLVRTRHMLNDFRRLMPHLRHESKFEKSHNLNELNEIAELANCTKCIYLENRKHQDLYLWLSDVKNSGPSVKFLVRNLHTMFELKFSGNCLTGSRPILSFDSTFDTKPHLQLIKNLIIGVFKTPNYHPKSQPFIDHVFNFSITSDGFIWVRNYQIVNDKGKLEEIGPRMVWEIIKVFKGSFSGLTLYENLHYKTPNSIRSQIKLQQRAIIINRKEQKDELKVKQDFIENAPIEDPVGDLFDTEKLEELKKLNEDARKLDRIIVKKRKKVSSKKKSKVKKQKIN